MSIVLQGSTSGSITLQEPAVAGSTVLDLPAVSGTILTSATAISASSITTGTLPKAQLPTGSVLQVVQATKTDSFSVTSTTFTDVTGMSVTITPTSSSSKILVIASIGGHACSTGDSLLQLVRGSTAINNGSSGFAQANSSQNVTCLSAINVFLDSPATTSATTYKVQQRADQGGQTAHFNSRPSGGVVVSSSITVMEIAA